jgi:glycosyltransferase involved in cell wall biosynthesis
LLENQRIAVVIPAYNEERLLPKTLASIPAFVDSIIVVDDHSADHTSEVARTYQADAPSAPLNKARPQSAPQTLSGSSYASAIKLSNLHVERHSTNKGVGAAIVTGYKIAMEQNIDIVVVMAADAQMDPADLPALLRPVLNGEADYAKGNRLSHPSVFRVMPLSRLFGSYILSLLTRPLCGYWSLLDSQCGYTAIHQRALQKLSLDELYPRYGYPNDLLVQLGARKLRIQDVVVRPVYGDEVSGFRPMTVAPKILYVLGRAALKRAQYHLTNR